MMNDLAILHDGTLAHICLILMEELFYLRVSVVTYELSLV